MSSASREITLITRQEASTHWTGGECEVLITEQDWRVISDSRDPKGPKGYLHVDENSPDAITDECRDMMIKYLYGHEPGLPGMGATPQGKYWGGLTMEDIERIGNSGKRGYYNHMRPRHEMTTTEAAEKWGVKRQTVITWINRGKIPQAVKVGRDWMIPMDAKQPADGRFVETPVRNRRKDK